jgi:squalene-hopene/tetraprenyl-beta-curcumene cyclase
MKSTIAVLTATLVLLGCDQEKAVEPNPVPPKTEAAVVKAVDAGLQKGIDWVLSKQTDTGAFDETSEVAFASFVVSNALRTPKADEYRKDPRLKKAVDFIIAQAQPDGSINTPGAQNLANYRTAAALSALTAYGDDKHEAVRKAAKDFLLGIQRTDGEDVGGWGYNSSKRADMSNTQFSLEALTDAGVPKDSEAFQRCVQFIQRCQNRSESNDQPYAGDDGGAMYFPGNSKAGMIELPDGRQIPRSYGSMTYALLRSYVLCGTKPDDARVQAAVQWLSENFTLDVNPGMPEGQEHQGLYYYFFSMAKALPLAGVKTLKLDDGTEVDWAKALAKRLISLQREDGSWVNEKADRWYEGNPVLATGYALAALAECRAVLAQ